VVIGNTHELKLLGVPAYQPGTLRNAGHIQANLKVDLLSLRKCGGTTESNTGHVTAACVTIQQRPGRALLWSAFCHHIVDVILSHVFDDMKIITTSSLQKLRYSPDFASTFSY